MQGELGRSLGEGALLVFIRGSGVLLLYALNAGLARLLGTAQFGIFTVATTALTILATAAGCGQFTAGLRYIPQYRTQAQPGLLHGFLAWSTRLVAAAGLVGGILCALLVALPGLIEPPYRPALLVACAILPISAVQQLWMEQTRGFGRGLAAYAWNATLVPVVALAGGWIWARQPGGLDAARATALIGAGTLLLALAHHLLLRRTALVDGPAPAPAAIERRLRRDWFGVGASLLAVSMAQFAMAQSGLFVLALLGTPEQVALYGAALRAAMAVLFLSATIDVVAAPRISRLFHGNAHGELQSYIRGLTTIMLVPAILATIVLVAGGGLLLSLFGPDFPRGATALSILAGGFALRLIAGPVDYLLMLSGHHREIARAILLAAVGVVVAGLALVPPLGIEGAALATAGGFAGLHMYLVLRARRLTGITCLPRFF